MEFLDELGATYDRIVDGPLAGLVGVLERPATGPL